jgi:hypothetical protein
VGEWWVFFVLNLLGGMFLQSLGCPQLVFLHSIVCQSKIDMGPPSTSNWNDDSEVDQVTGKAVGEANWFFHLVLEKDRESQCAFCVGFCMQCLSSASLTARKLLL